MCGQSTRGCGPRRLLKDAFKHCSLPASSPAGAPLRETSGGRVGTEGWAGVGVTCVGHPPFLPPYLCPRTCLRLVSPGSRLRAGVIVSFL